MQENTWPTVSEKEIESVVSWIRDYLSPDKNAVVGVSGGIDSSVILALCLRAVGKDRVIAVSLPCGASSVIDNPFVKDLKIRFGINYETISLFTTYRVLCDDIPIHLSGEDHKEAKEFDLWKGNIKARLRMTALYAVAGANNGIVIGTTNKSEYEIGYATKFGDHGVDIEPIQEFYKTEVFEMGKILGVPQSIIDRKPTANLWNGQTDEDEIGMSYPEIDSYLRDPKNDIPEKLNKMIVNSEHKKNVPPSYKRSK